MSVPRWLKWMISWIWKLLSCVFAWHIFWYLKLKPWLSGVDNYSAAILRRLLLHVIKRSNTSEVLQKLMTDQAVFICDSLQTFHRRKGKCCCVAHRRTCPQVYLNYIVRLAVKESVVNMNSFFRRWKKRWTRTFWSSPFFPWVAWTTSPWWWRCTLPTSAASWGPSMLCWSWTAPCPVTGDITLLSW